jgi:spore photoproduct lyase
VLQAYFQENHIKCFVNIYQILDQVIKQIDENPSKIFRVGTGEFTDSLALDSLMGWSDRLVQLFSQRKNAILEFKTKTVSIEGLLRFRERKNIVVSWSLNSPEMAATEEHRAPGLRARLEAARRCQDEGYMLGLHFDPLIYHRSWREGYQRTVEMLDSYLRPERIIWISLGSLRFMPSLKAIVRKRRPSSRILDGEFVTGLDGKLRYFKPIRLELYGWLREILDAWSRDLGLYLCMESDDVWSHALGWSPSSSQGLSLYLDERVKRFFG